MFSNFSLYFFSRNLPEDITTSPGFALLPLFGALVLDSPDSSAASQAEPAPTPMRSSKKRERTPDDDDDDDTDRKNPSAYTYAGKYLLPDSPFWSRLNDGILAGAAAPLLRYFTPFKSVNKKGG